MGLKLRLFVMMALLVSVHGASAAKLFPYMGMLGFSPIQQTLAGSAWAFATVFGIFFSNQFADRNFAAERFLAVTQLLSGLALIGTAYSRTFVPFFCFFLAHSLLHVPSISVAYSIAFANLPDPAQDFGKIRIGGTVGWIAVSWPFVFLLSAHPSEYEVRWIFLLSAMIAFALGILAFFLPHTPPRKNPVDPLAWRAAFKMLKTPVVAVLFLVTFIDSVVHNGYYVVSDAFLTNRVGIAGNMSMVVLSLGQIAEIATMLVLGRALTRLGWRLTMFIGICGHIVRALVFAFFPDNIPLIVAIQLVHGVCYGFFFASVYIFVDQTFPKDIRVSGQGLFNLLILGVGSVVANMLFPGVQAMLTHAVAGGGVVTDYRTLFLMPAGLAGVAALILAVAFRPSTFGPATRPEHIDGPELATDPGTAQA